MNVLAKLLELAAVDAGLLLVMLCWWLGLGDLATFVGGLLGVT